MCCNGADTEQSGSPDLGLEVLETLGITISPPCGTVRRNQGWLSIGLVIINSSGIRIIPCHEITMEQWRKLISAAAQAWRADFKRGMMWRYEPDLGWVAEVLTRYWPERRTSAMRSSAARPKVACSAVEVPSRW